MGIENDLNTPVDQLLIHAVYSRLKGYGRIFREEVLLVKLGFSDAEYVLHRIICDSIVDWDPRHTMFGTFERDYEKMSVILGWKVSKVRRIFQKICDCGFYSCIDPKRNVYRVVGYELRNDYQFRTNNNNHCFHYLASLLETIQKSNIDNEKSSQRFIEMMDLFKDLEHNFPKLKDLNPRQATTKAQSSSKYRFNLGASSGKYSSDDSMVLSKEDQQLVSEILEDEGL